MTVPEQQGRHVRPVEEAIADALRDGNEVAVMRAVAACEVVVPQTSEVNQEDLEQGSISLPVIEREGMSYVPVFTSEGTMNEAAPEIENAVAVAVSDLAANWPESDLWLAVNPGTDGALTLPPDAVRSLPEYTDEPPS